MEGDPLAPGEEVQQGVLHRGLGHGVAAHLAEAGQDLAQGAAGVELLEQEIPDEVPGGGGGLAVVVGVRVGHAFAPAHAAALLQAQEEGLLHGPAGHAGAEGLHEGDAHHHEINAIQGPEDDLGGRMKIFAHVSSLGFTSGRLWDD